MIAKMLGLRELHLEKLLVLLGGLRISLGLNQGVRIQLEDFAIAVALGVRLQEVLKSLGRGVPLFGEDVSQPQKIAETLHFGLELRILALTKPFHQLGEHRNRAR